MALVGQRRELAAYFMALAARAVSRYHFGSELGSVCMWPAAPVALVDAIHMGLISVS